MAVKYSDEMEYASSAQAISGLHVSIFGMTLYRLLRRAGLPFWASGIPSMLLVLSYGVLTGMSTSTARAVIMFLLSVAAENIHF